MRNFQQYILYTILCLSFVFRLQAKDNDKQVMMPQEKVYLHFDQAGYFLKETVWFKAYVLDESNRPSDISKVLYVELVAPEGGVLKTHKYRLDHGMCHGSIRIDSTYLSGLFEVRAYTRYMRNFGEDNYFTRVFPVYDDVENGAYHYRTMLTRSRDKHLVRRWKNAMEYKKRTLSPKEQSAMEKNIRKIRQHYTLFTPSPILCDSIPAHILPGEKIELTFHTIPNSTFSLSVSDAGTQVNDCYHHDIYHTLFLDTAWIRRSRTALTTPIPENRLYYAPEQKITLDGTVEDKKLLKKKRQEKDIPVYMTCNMNGTFLNGKTSTDEWGRWAFETDSLYGDYEATLLAVKTDEHPSIQLNVNKWFSPEARPYTDMEKRMGTDTGIPEEYVPEDSVGLAEDIRNLEEITVKGHPKKLFRYAKTSPIHIPYAELMERITDDGYKEMYGICNIAEYLFERNGLPPGCARAIYVDKDQYPGDDKVPVRIEGSPILDDNWFIPESVKEIIVRTDPSICQCYDYKPTKIALPDGTVMDINDPQAASFRDKAFSSGGKVPEHQWIYKNGDANHVRYVVCLLEDTGRRDTTDRFHYLNNDAFLAMGITRPPYSGSPSRRKTYIRGFTPYKPFPSPDNTLQNSLDKDFRRTLYWNPEVKTDRNGVAHVTFYNNSSCHSISISAEGIGENLNPIVYTTQNTTTLPQATDSLYTKVKNFGKGLPQEKVYLHIDNTCYFVGDTIRYKGYVTRSDKGTLTDLSKILYVELLTPDGYLVERQQLKMPKGTAHGAFILTDSLYAGYYELRAYTRWMLNFGQYEHPHAPFVEKNFYNRDMAKAFFRNYDKLYARVFPVYDRPKEEGIYTKEMTCRQMRRYHKERKEKPELSLKFYPEGGKMIQGTTCRIAFELATEDGEHLDAELSIRDKEGNEVANTATTHRGRGVFTLPDVSRQANYRAVFRHEGYDYEVLLPEAEQEGISLQAYVRDSLLHLRLERSKGIPATKELALHIMSGGVTKAYRRIRFGEHAATAEIDLPADELPTGVNQITLYDESGQVYAERLVFINHHEYENTRLAIGNIKTQYQPYEPIELHLRLPQPIDTTATSISLSIRDRATEEAIYDNGTILTEMLLGSELKGFIETPGYYFEKDDSIHRRDLDLLMMVQGWRRYEWRKMAGTEPFKLTYLPEKFQTLRGSVHRTYSLPNDNLLGEPVVISGLSPSAIQYYTTAHEASSEHIDRLQDLYSTQIKQMKTEVNVVASFTQGTNTLELMQATEKGQFYMQMPELYEYGTLSLIATDSREPTEDIIRKQKKGYTDEKQYPDYYVKLEHFHPVFPKPYDFYQKTPAFDFVEVSDSAERYSFTNRKMPAVIIRNPKGGLRKVNLQQPAAVIDVYDAYNLITDYGMNCGIHDWRTFSHQVATAFIGDMGLARHYFLQERFDGKPLNSRPRQTTSLPHITASLGTTVPGVDNTPVSTPDFILSPKVLEKYQRLRNIDKLYIYTDYMPREQGSWKYTQTNQPDVIIDYRLFPDNGYRHTFRDRHSTIKGYSVCDDFYSPDYSRKPLPDTKDYRRTLLWVPEVRFNNRGEATVKLYNNSKTTVISIETEGITGQGQLIH